MNHKNIKRAGVILCELLALGTVISLLAAGRSDRLLLAVGTLFLVLMPAAVERIFRWELSLPVYLFALIYALGPMLGHCWNFYYMGFGWDKVLHTCGGVMFAIMGVYLFGLLTGQKNSSLAGVIFALCFSVAIAVFWEFAEFAADRFLGMDMQNDTLITGITSYLLGEGMGIAGRIENIQSVTVNGVALPVNGYIDIGLMDTMMDMLLESLGAVITCVLLFFDKERHPLIRKIA